MDMVRLINKALSDADIQMILGNDGKIIEYVELGPKADANFLKVFKAAGTLSTKLTKVWSISVFD